MNEKFLEDTKCLFIAKSQELHKEGKTDQLSKNTVETIIYLINSLNLLKNDAFLTNTFSYFLINTQNKNEEFDYEYKLKESNDTKYNLNELENFMENLQDETIEFENILHELGPFIINNSILIKSDIIDLKLDEKRLSNFILFLCKNQNWVEDNENRYLNKVFLKSLNNDLSMTIDENYEKKININWNIENFYKLVKKQIDSMDVRN